MKFPNTGTIVRTGVIAVIAVAAAEAFGLSAWIRKHLKPDQAAALSSTQSATGGA